MFDYIIVGAGTAGCVLASRLSEDADVRVLVLEAGGPDAIESVHVPVAFGQLFKTALDWDYTTAPEPHCSGRRIYLPRGKVLGGCSSCNAMVYMRGNPADYQEWLALGNDGWGYQHVLEYFKRAEHNERGASEYHGVAGPLWVSDGRSRNVMMEAFVAAAQQAELEYNDDFNGPRQDGVGYYQVTQRDGFQLKYTLAHHNAQSAVACTMAFADVASQIGANLTRTALIDRLETDSFDSGMGQILRWPHGDHGREPYAYHREYLYEWVQGDSAGGFGVKRIRPDPVTPSIPS